MGVFCYDLDGTLCRTEGQHYELAEPIWSEIERLKERYERGDRIVIDTARGSGSGEDWHQRTARQLARWGVPYHVLRCGVKFPADFYIDDRAERPEHMEAR